MIKRSFLFAAVVLALLRDAPSVYGQEEIFYVGGQTQVGLFADPDPAGEIVYGVTSFESTASRVNHAGSATSFASLDRRMAKLEVDASGISKTEMMSAFSGASSVLRDTVRLRTNSQVDLVAGGSIEFDYYLAWRLNGDSYSKFYIGDFWSDYYIDHFQDNQLNLNAPDQFGRSFGQYTMAMPLSSVVAVAEAEGEWLASFDFSLSLLARSYAGGSDFLASPSGGGIVEFVITGGRVWDSTRTIAYPIIDEFQTAAGDFNADGRVDGVDFLEWQRGNGDASGDRTSGEFDLEIWEHQFGQGWTPDLVLVPEPSSLALSVIVAATLLLQSRRQTR